MTAATVPLDLGPGVYDSIPNETYHQLEAVGSTTLKGLLDPDNAGAFDSRGRVPMASTSALQLGTVAHSVILEGDTSGVEVIPYDDYRTAAAKEARADALAAGRIALKPEEWEQVKAMRDAVMAHPVARALLTGHVAEQTIITRDPDTGALVKVRPDARTAVIADLKTAADANPYTVERKVIPERGYHLSAALYTDVVKAELDLDLEFHLIVVEKTRPYRVSVVQIGDQYLADGRARCRRALDLYAHGIATGEWPTWPTTYTAEPPLWLLDQTTRLTEGA